MKKNLVFSVLLFLSVSCVSQNPQNNPDMNTTEHLTYFRFDHHNTMRIFYGENYYVSKEKDGRVHVVIDEGFPKEMDFFINDTTIFDELLAIVKQFKMDKYKSNYQPSIRIFDGDSWSLYYKYDSGRSVSSGGYMDWPDNYREARAAISDYFQKWREYAAETKRIDLFQYTCQNNQGCDIEYRLERGENEATLTIRNAEYDTDKQLLVSNDYLAELQELVNMYRLKDESSNTTDDDSVTKYSYLVCYNTGDTLDIRSYRSSFEGGKEQVFKHFFELWLPVRGNLVRMEYSWNTGRWHDIKYYVLCEGERFSLSYYDDKGDCHEGELDRESMDRLQKLIESFDLDKAKDRYTGQDKWTLYAVFDSTDSFRVAGSADDEASEEKARHILEALEEFFAPYFK